MLRNLEKKLPSTLYELYERRFNTCCRRRDSEHEELVKFLLYLVAHSFRPPLLDEVNTLLQHDTKDPEFSVDEIPEAFTYFLRVGDPGSDAETREQIQSMGGYSTAVQDLEKTSDNRNRIYDDGVLPIKFHERSMRSFFHSGKGDSQLHWSPSDAHRRIFLKTAELAKFAPNASLKKLAGTFGKYATTYTLQHWREIDLEQHSPAEQAEVMETLWGILTDQHGFARMVELNGFDGYEHGSRYADNFGKEGFEKIAKWAKLAQSDGDHPGLSEDAAQWWKDIANDPKQALVVLAKAHLKRMYQAKSLGDSISPYNGLLFALETVSLFLTPI